MSKFKLTKANYYSKDADREYMSASQVKSFMSCEARALAEINGKYTRPDTSALLIGSYIDAYFEGKSSFEQFKKNNPTIFNSKTGELKADFKKCDEMIERIKSDKVFMDFMKGRKQTIKTGQICGVPFKCKFDVYKKGERIVDLKTVKDLSPKYRSGEGRLSPISYWHWDLQMAIYSEVEGNGLPTYLAIVTKENPPDIEIIEVDSAHRQAELEMLKEKIVRYDAIKRGYIEPERCEHCDYCRATHKLTRPKTMDEIEFELYTGEVE